MNYDELKYLFDNSSSASNAIETMFNTKKPSNKHVILLRNKMLELGLDYDNKPNANTKYRDSDIFRKGVEWPTSYLRGRYLKLETPYKCSRCGLSTWQGKKITLELDHIDGHPDNNELSNLRWLCPNCHSQQPTSKGANKHGRKYRGVPKNCLYCHKRFTYEPSKNRKFCSKECSNKYSSIHSRHKLPVSKNELYNLLMENSFSAVGRMYSVTGNAIVKWCIKYNIPSKATYYKNK